jgi:uncharacterized protein
MNMQAFATHSISESVVSFVQFVRTHGLNVGIQETQDALIAAKEIRISDRGTFKYALKALFCNSPEDGQLFERLFRLFWDTNPVDLDYKIKTTVQGSAQNSQARSLVMMGRGKSGQAKEEVKSTTGASAAERLRKVDFSKLTDVDAKQLEHIANQLYKEMAIRLRRRRQSLQQENLVHLRRTIRRSISAGGEPIDLYFKAQKPKKQRLVVFLDVSGSMDKYSYFLLRFIFALRSHFRQLEAFLFSTKLLRISNLLTINKLDYATTLLSRQVDNWSSGTTIGNCFKEFTERYGKRILNGSPTLVILSDGLDTGEPELLASEMRKIRRKSRRIVWLNPLKSMTDYAPIQRGMKAALPSVHDFRSAHNLNSLLELENILLHV